jgi:HAD superfamily hydrolase (TIGR01509 family)
MDGVIVDSEVYWHELEETRILPATLGEDRPDPNETTGMNFREIYDYLDANYDPQVGKEEFVSLYDRTAREIYRDRASLMPGFRELCTRLYEAGVTVGVVSSSPQAWIDIVRERFGLSFDAIVSAEDVDGPGKPQPDIYEFAAEGIGVKPSECLVVEDSVNGTCAADRAGMAVIGYRGAANADLELPAADVVVSGPEELRAELGRRLDVEV